MRCSRPPLSERSSFAVAVRLLDQHAEAAALGGADDRIRKFGEVVLPQGRHREADHPGLPRSEAAGRHVRPVVQLADRGQHTFACLPPDMGIVVDDVGDGLDGDACRARDVMQRGPHESRPSSHLSRNCTPAAAPVRRPSTRLSARRIAARISATPRHLRAGRADQEVEIGARVGLQHVVDVQLLPAADRRRDASDVASGTRRRCSSSSVTSSSSRRPRTSSRISSPFCTSPSGPPAAASGVTCSTTVPYAVPLMRPSQMRTMSPHTLLEQLCGSGMFATSGMPG